MGNVMPARSGAEKQLCANLDKLISDPFRFELHGNVHELKPVTTMDFYRLTETFVNWDKVTKDESSTADDVRNALLDIIQSMCSTITEDDLKKATRIQLRALYVLITEHINGRSHEMSEEELKKKMNFRT